VDKPRHGLQLSFGDVVGECFEEDADAWLWRFYSRKQVRDDAFEQRHVLHIISYHITYIC